MTATQSLLTTTFPDLPWQLNKPLAPLTYFKIGGPAEIYVELDQADQILAVVTFCRTHQIKITLFGGASNVVVADQGISGVVLHLTNREISLEPNVESDLSTVVVGAGCPNSLLVGQTLQWHLTGLEPFLGVPGSVGGSIYNNAHYLSQLIGDHVAEVQVITADNDLVWLPAAACDFRYDHSRFQTSHEIIIAVKFALAAGSPEESKKLIRDATLYRAKTQPLGEPSSGCIFQNTPNTPELKRRFPQFATQDLVPGGFLIDQAGLKGTRIGDIEVSQKHAAFFVNRGGGTADQVRQLIAQVQQTIKAKFGVELEAEVFYLE